jgi:hypothetical protein
MLLAAKDLVSRLQLSIALLQTSPEKVSNRTIGVPVSFFQKSDVKKHLAHGLQKSHYLTPTQPDTLAEKVDQESAAAADNTVTSLNNSDAVLVDKLPQRL